MKTIMIAAVMIISIGLTGVDAGVDGDSTAIENACDTSKTQYILTGDSRASISDVKENTIAERVMEVFENKGVIEVVTGANQDEVIEIMVVNLKGDTVYEGVVSGYSSTISLEEKIQPGIYMVQANAGDVQRTKRLVIR